ncbi:MAG: ribonuclease J [bacterium]|nr:ribonuclease J [bacterium]
MNYRKQNTRGRHPRRGGSQRSHLSRTTVPKPSVTLGPDGAPPLHIYALGGLEEVGRNCTVVECGDDIVIIDLGLMFPEEGMPGIDYVIPNISCLQGKEKNIRGVIITHGHYDHIGGIPHLMGRMGYPPLYTAPLTAGIIRKRQEEYPDAKKLVVSLIKNDSKIQFGKNFVFEPFHVNHNISDAFGVALQTPYGPIIFTGDFKFDYTPVNDEPADLNLIAMFGSKNVLALLSDSTDSTSPGHQISEKTVGDELFGIIQSAKGRVIIGTFASLLPRIQQVITIAESLGKKVMLEGRSLNNNVDLAKELGYMKIKPGTIIEEKEARRLPPEKLVVLCTGAQGEKNAVLMRIANSEHPFLEVIPNDTIIFSSSVIPGNERTVQNLKDTLVRHGARIVHYENMDVHAGGHAKQEDLKLMIRLTKPKYFIPIHGNRFMLQAHAELAEGIGIPKENIFVADNGQIIEFAAKGARLTDEYIPTDHIMVDGLGVGDVSHVILRERQQMAEDGMFVVIVTMDQKTGAMIGSPDIISRGFVYMKESRELIEKARARIKKILKDSDRHSPAFEDYIKNKIRNEVGQFLFSQTRRRPMILPVLIEV